MEEQKQDVQRGKITRTVRLTPEVDAKLVRLAEELGTTINAYLNVETVSYTHLTLPTNREV